MKLKSSFYPRWLLIAITYRVTPCLGESDRSLSPTCSSRLCTAHHFNSLFFGDFIIITNPRSFNFVNDSNNEFQFYLRGWMKEFLANAFFGDENIKGTRKYSILYSWSIVTAMLERHSSSPFENVILLSADSTLGSQTAWQWCYATNLRNWRAIR